MLVGREENGVADSDLRVTDGAVLYRDSAQLLAAQRALDELQQASVVAIHGAAALWPEAAVLPLSISDGSGVLPPPSV